MSNDSTTPSSAPLTPTRRQVLQAGGLAMAGVLAGHLPHAAAGTSSSETRPLAESMLFGVCGHPLYSAAYNANSSETPGVPYATQVSMLTQLGAQSYRFDVQTNDAGLCNNHAKLLDMYGRLDAAGIEFFPTFYANYSADLSPEDNYVRGRAKGEAIATNYGHMFTACGLDNEWELKRGLKFEGRRGTEESHYDMPKVDRAIQWIKGANDGMKSVKSDVRTSVAVAGWFPTVWQQKLLDEAGLDIVDWHWYADQQSNIHALPEPYDEITNILDFLWNEYGRPIWITETNSRAQGDLSDDQNEERQVDWYEEWYAQCLAHPHCEKMFLYELLNEPIREPDSHEEANFGLVKFPNFDLESPDHTDWEWKRLGRRLIGLDHQIGHFGSDEGWVLGLGSEYPGAQGTFTRDTVEAISGRWSALLTGDFSGGGNYVQISRPIDLDLSDLWLWARSGELTAVTLRMTDSTGQIHQQRLPLTPDLTWQAMHVSAFDAGTGYAHWGGANDGVWHGPAQEIALLLGRTQLESGVLSGAVRFDGVVATVP